MAKKLRSSISTVLAASMLLSVFPAGMLHLPSFSLFSDNAIADVSSQNPGSISCLQRTMTDSFGNKYTFCATCSADSGIPSDAELDVKEILAGTEYDAYLADTQAALDIDKIGYAHFFDITIVKDGVEIQPEDGSKVNMQIFLEDATTEDLNVVHFPEAPGNGTAEVVENTTSSEGDTTIVGFDAESFSVYGIVSTIVTTTVTTSDGNTYKITATFDETSGIPSDAQLAVSEVSDSEYIDYLTSATQALGESIHSVSYGKLFDIALVKNGVKYQPVDGSTVKVKVELMDTENVDDVKVVHFEGDKAEELSASTKGSTVSFETDGFSVFSFIDFSLISRYVTATIDKVAGASGTKSGTLYSNDDIIISGSMPSTGIVEAKRVDVSVDGKNTLVAYDIKIYANEVMKLLGITWQPSESALQVQLKSDAISTKTVDVYHMEDAGSPAELVSGNIGVADKAVVFNANSFSVYVIVEHEGQEIITPRVEFHYISRDYQENSNGTTYSYTASPYEFLNRNNEYQISQILRDGESLEQVVNPPNKKDNAGNEVSFFYGWYTVTVNDRDTDDTTAYNSNASASPYYNGTITYTWPDPQKINDRTAISITPNDENSNGVIEAGESVTWSIGGTTGTAVLDAEGTAHVYIAPVYEDYYFINFHMGNKEADEGLRNNLLTRRLVVFGQNDSAIVRIGDVEGPSPDPAHEMFAGWETADFSDPSNPQTVLYYETLDMDGNERDIHHDGTSETAGTAGSGYRVTVNKVGSALSALDLYPIFAEARWVYFNTGLTGNGAKYVGAEYRLTNDELKGTSFTSFPTTSRPGYDFLGWYLSKDSNENGTGIQLTDGTGAFVNSVKGQAFYGTAGNISTDPSAGEKLFEITSDGKLYVYKALDALTVYAKWTAQTVDYKVLVWLQNANDDEYTLAWFNTYSAVAGTTLFVNTSGDNDRNIILNKESDTGAVQQTIALSTSDISILRFIHKCATPYSDYNGYTTSGNTTTETGVTVEGDGSTIINVYYDRNEYTLRFDIGFARKTSNNGSVTTYTSMTDSEAESYSGTVYGLVNGTYVALTPDGNGGWTYSGTVNTRHDYNGYRYQATTGSANPQYGVVNGSVVEISGSISYTGAAGRYTPTTSNNGTQYGIVNGSIQRVYRVNNVWRVGNNGTAAQYTGTRYSQNNNGNNGAYTGTVYYPGNGSFITETTYSTTPYGTNGTYYFPLNENSSWTYNNGANSYSGTRYLRVDNNDANTNYNLGFINGSMQTILKDAQGWYYNTQDAATLTYAGTLYKQTSIAGTWNFYVSTITNTDNYNDFLTNTNANLGTTMPDDFAACEYYTATANGTDCLVFYYDLTARYGETILDRYPGTQPPRTGYRFVGWIPQQNSYFWATQKTSIKGSFETLTEDLILTGATYTNYNSGKQNVDPNSCTAITSDVGIAQEFRCRYQGSTNNYLYRVYLADPDTLQYPSTPSFTQIVSAGTSSYPDMQTATTLQGYGNGNGQDTPAESYQLSSTGARSALTHSYSGYAIQELTDAGVGNGMIIEFYYLPNQHSISYMYGSGSSNPNTPVDANHPSWTYHYNQSLADADRYTSEAIAATPVGHSFIGWYENLEGVGNTFNFNKTMPDGDIVLYAVYKPLKYRVMVNPNGAEIDHIDHTGSSYNSFGITPFNRSDNGEYAADSGYNGSQATYINADYGVTISEYAVSRDKVPIGDAAAESYSGRLYYYVNGQYTSSDGPGVPSHLRNALYIDVTDGTGVYVNDDPSQGYTELYQYYDFWHQYTLARLNQNPDDYVGMTAQNLSYDAWKNLYIAKQSDGVKPQLYRKCNSQENWVFLGWFKDNDTMPYIFSDPVSTSFTLTAHWRLDGGYTIQYMPENWLESSDGNRYLINGAMQAWIDPDPAASTGAFSYTDGASTTVYKQPTNLTQNGEEITDNTVNFLGWRLVSVSRTTINGQVVETYTPLEDGVLYDPGDDFVIDVQYADSNNIIHMQAVYEETNSSVRRPNVANLTLDANGGYLVDASGNDLTADDNLPWSGVGTILMDESEEQIVFGDIQSNAAAHLYKYATNDADTGLSGGTNYFKHMEGYLLLGFDLQPDPENIVWVDPQNSAITGAAQPYVPNYPADSIISVQRTDDEILYAIWEPMVYVTFENKTAGTVEFSLSSADGALEVINVKNGMYNRAPLNSSDVITLNPAGQDGDTVTLAFPKGAEKTITVSGTNNLGPGKVLIWDTSIALEGDRTYSSNPAVDPDPNNDLADPDTEFNHTVNNSTHTHALASGEKNNLQDFSFNEKLLVNKNPLTVTFTSRDNAYALLLNDNWNGDGTGGGQQEIDYGLDDIQPDTSVTPAEPKYQDLPVTSTRFGYSFLGWAYSPTATTPDFPATGGRIDDLNRDDGFFSTGTVVIDGVITRTLYGVWEPLKDAVYIHKEVPEPGNQTKLFDFTVAITGNYHVGTMDYAINAQTNEYSVRDTSKVFSIRHGEYLRVVSTNDHATEAGHNTAFIEVEVEVYMPDTSSGTLTYVKDDTRSGIVRWERHVTNPGSNNGFTGLQITVTEAAVTYYTTSVTLDYEGRDNELTLGTSSFNTSEIPQTVSTNKVSWTNPDAYGTVTYKNEIETYDISVQKILISNKTDDEDFNFTASYILDEGQSDEVTVDPVTDPSPFIVTSGTTNSVALVKIPAGAKLTITEEADDNYETTITRDGTVISTDTKTITFDVTADSAIVYTNTLKSYPVKFIKIDQNGTAGVVAATFNLVNKTGSYNVGTNLQAYDNTGSDGVFYVSGTDDGNFGLYEPLYAGQTYTLTETFTESGYLGLNGPVTITVSGDENDPFTISNPDVTAEWDNTNKVWIFRVKNVEKKDITIVKAFNDPLLNQRTFKFSWSYKYDSDRNGAIDTATEVFTGTFTLSPFTGSSANTKISVPVGATDLVVTELHTNEGTDQYAWVATAYDTTFRLNNGTDTAGYAYTILSVSDEVTITFTNTRKTVPVTVKKQVVGPGSTFDFEALLSYSAAIGNYTLNDNGTPTVVADDLITGTDGKALFSLSPAKDDEDSIILTVPYGAYLTVSEMAPGSYSTSVQVGTGTSQSGLTTGQLTITEATTITFTNTQVLIAPTGFEEATTPYVWLFILGLMIMIAMNAPFFFLRRMRKKEEEAK
ncbi:MAG: InlB B-repeat-containing protein [Clostridiales bacterium]|nr:InlB B-repeat-containing protein [Clostridiales bacterium]